MGEFEGEENPFCRCGGLYCTKAPELCPTRVKIWKHLCKTLITKLFYYIIYEHKKISRIIRIPSAARPKVSGKNALFPRNDRPYGLKRCRFKLKMLQC